MGVLEPEVGRSTPIHEGMRGNDAQDHRRPSWVPNADRLFGVSGRSRYRPERAAFEGEPEHRGRTSIASVWHSSADPASAC